MAKRDGDPASERRNRPGALAGDAAGVADAAFRRNGFTDPALVLHWKAIAGPDIARLCRPLKLSEGAQGGVLTLLAEPAAAVFLQHESRILCAAINTYLGRPAVARLKFVPGVLSRRSPPPAGLKPATALAPDDPVQAYRGPESLREALQRLARARHSRC